MNKHAQALGRLGKGVPRKITEADRQRRVKQAKQMRCNHVFLNDADCAKCGKKKTL